MPDLSEDLASSLGKFQASCGSTLEHQITELPKRGSKRKSPRGLPSDEDLIKLAAVYLEEQRRLWPGIGTVPWLPVLDDSTTNLMAADFRSRFIQGSILRFDHRLAGGHAKDLGTAYLRYSSDKSNERSLDDQLANILRKAAEEQRFIPWCWVFADSATSGVRAMRRGYRLVKSLLEQTRKGGGPDTVYIDDFTRASRDAVESYRLARLLPTMQKRLIGATDGFDLDSPQASTQVAVTAMFSDMFIKQTQQKVRRGMKGAARRRTSTGKPALGYKLEPIKGADGKPVMGARGRAIKMLVIDPEAAEHVRVAFRALGFEHKSYSAISQHLNAIKAGGEADMDTDNPSCIVCQSHLLGRSHLQS